VQVHPHTSSESEDEGVLDGRKSVSRPPLRTASTHWTVSRRYMPPMASQKSAHTIPQPPTPRPGDAISQPFNLPVPNQALDLNLQIPDASSAGETTFSPPSSDADVDSHTDESSPEPDVTDNAVPGVVLYYSNENQSQEIDFFSASQPVTPRTDHVLATSPASTRMNVGLDLSMSSTSPVGTTSKAKDWNSVTAPSSPERRYKRLFHGPVIEMPKMPPK